MASMTTSLQALTAEINQMKRPALKKRKVATTINLNHYYIIQSDPVQSEEIRAEPQLREGDYSVCVQV